MYAIDGGKFDMVKLLVKSGAKINVSDDKGRTPAHICAENGNVKIMAYLIEKGANINLENSRGETPLDIALKKGNFEIVSLFLKNDVNVKDPEKLAETLRAAGKKELANFAEEKYSQKGVRSIQTYDERAAAY